MLTDARFHRRSNSQGLMNPSEVVVHVKQGDHCDMIFEFLAEGVSQASKAPHIHPHVQVLALDVAGADVFGIWRADDIYAFGPKTLRRAVALLSFRIASVNFHQLRVINVLGERIRYRS